MVTRPIQRSVLVVAVAAIGAACGDDPLASRQPVATVSVVPRTVNVEVGRTAELAATVMSASGDTLRDRKVFWASENGDMARVSSNGVVIGAAPGTIQVAASSEGQSGVSIVTVEPRRVATIAISPTAAEISVGQTVRLKASTFDQSGSEVTAQGVS